MRQTVLQKPSFSGQQKARFDCSERAFVSVAPDQSGDPDDYTRCENLKKYIRTSTKRTLRLAPSRRGQRSTSRG